MPMLPPVVVELVANGQKLTAGLDKATADIDNMSKKGATSFDKLQAAAGKYGTAIGAAMTAAGAALQKVAGPLETAHAQLKQAVENAGYDFTEFSGKINDTVKAQENYGHTSADTQQALQKLTSALGDPTKAIADMGMAADIAAVKHISLSDAAGLIVKMSAGSGKVFKEFGLNLKDYGTGAEAAQLATDALKLKLNGMAEATAATTQGKFDALRAKVTDLAAEFGQKLVPVLTTAGPLLMGISSGLPLLAKGFSLLVANLGPVAIALGAVTVGFLTWKYLSDAAKKPTDELTASMKSLGLEASDAGTKIVTGVVASTKDGVAALAGAGVSVSQLSDALHGNKDAYTAADKALKSYALNMKVPDNLAHAAINIMRALEGQKTAVDGVNKAEADKKATDDLLAQNQLKLKGATDDTTASIDAQKEAAKQAAADEVAATAFQKKASDDLQKSYADRQKAVEDLAAVVGDKNAEMIKWTGLSTAEIADVAKSTKQTKDDVEKGFGAMGTAVDKFSTQTKITAGDVKKFYTDQVTSAQEWEKNVKALMQSGLNDDIITPLIQAGPKAAPLVKATLAEVAKEGAGVLNTLDTEAKAAEARTEKYVLDSKSNIIAAGQGIAEAVDGWARALPTSVSISVGRPDGIKNPKAIGGNMVGRTPYYVGEEGPELFIPDGSGTLVNNNALRTNAVGGGGNAVAGQVIDVVVNAGMGTDGASVGRQIRDALRADVRVSGYGQGSPLLL